MAIKGLWDTDCIENIVGKGESAHSENEYIWKKAFIQQIKGGQMTKSVLERVESSVENGENVVTSTLYFPIMFQKPSLRVVKSQDFVVKLKKQIYVLRWWTSEHRESGNSHHMFVKDNNYTRYTCTRLTGETNVNPDRLAISRAAVSPPSFSSTSQEFVSISCLPEAVVQRPKHITLRMINPLFLTHLCSSTIADQWW